MIKKYKDFLNEEFVNNSIEFTEEQKEKAQKLFQEVFDIYLKKVSFATYPMIYHCTEIDNLSEIEEDGLTNDRNYFLEYDNDFGTYIDSDEPGIACAVNYKDVIDRLYPDPEWGDLTIIKKTSNPENFKEKGIDDRILYCLWITDNLKMDLNNVTIEDIIKEKLDDMVSENMFCWLYVKGKISPKIITIEIHPDLK